MQEEPSRRHRRQPTQVIKKAEKKEVKDHPITTHQMDLAHVDQPAFTNAWIPCQQSGNSGCNPPPAQRKQTETNSLPGAGQHRHPKGQPLSGKTPAGQPLPAGGAGLSEGLPFLAEQDWGNTFLEGRLCHCCERQVVSRNQLMAVSARCLMLSWCI